MVFIQNMKKKSLLFLFVNFFFLLNSCSYNYKNDYKQNLSKIEKIIFNVDSLQIKKETLKKIKSDYPAVQNANNLVLSKFESWVFDKFKLNNSSGEAIINLYVAEVVLLNKTKKKKFFFQNDKEFYQIRLKFDLVFNKKLNNSKNIKINASVDFLFSQELSLIKSEQLLINKLNILINKVDKKITNDLKDKIFQEFIKTNQ